VISRAAAEGHLGWRGEDAGRAELTTGQLCLLAGSLVQEGGWKAAASMRQREDEWTRRDNGRLGAWLCQSQS
jgi:hypothetical protein